MKKLVRIILYSLFVLLVLLLILSYASVYISPQKIWVLAFFGLAYPYILIANIIILIIILLRKKWKLAAVSGIFILIGYNHFSNYVNFTLFNNTPPENSIQVLSYNVRYFDLYNWTDNIKTRNKIIDYLKEKDADILCFQEFYTDREKEFATTDDLIKILSAKNYYDRYTATAYQRHSFGIATFTKYPIANKGMVNLPDSENICIYTDLVVDQDTIRVYNCHLESIRFGEEHYKFIDELQFDINERQIEGARSLANKMKQAYMKRAEQAEIIAEHIQESPFPVILCGDFNDTPVSYTYHTISNGLYDAFAESGVGFAKSYAGELPALRIDYILHSKEFNSYGFDHGTEPLSDHFPVYAWLQLK